MKTIQELAALSHEELAAAEEACRVAIVGLYEERRAIRGMLLAKHREAERTARRQGRPFKGPNVSVRRSRLLPARGTTEPPAE